MACKGKKRKQCLTNLSEVVIIKSKITISEFVKVLRDIKEVVADYAIIGGTMAVLTAIIKPFICWKKTVRDLILSFLGSMLCGLLLEYWEIPYAVKVGISGTCGLFAVKIYEVIESILQRIKENPDKIIDKLEKQRLQPPDYLVVFV